MNLFVWPYLKIEENWTIPDNIMLTAWNKMVELNRIEATFYDGGIKNFDDFISFMRDPMILPALVVNSDKVKFYLLAWLSDFCNGVAYGHFCYLSSYHGDIAKAIIDYWKKIELLRVIVGITPASYKLVLKIIQRTGFQIVGEIPQICNMHYQDRIEQGVISYYLMKGE